MSKIKKTSSKRKQRSKRAKKKPKIKLNNKSVIFLSCVIVFLCGIFLILNIKFNSESNVAGIPEVSKISLDAGSAAADRKTSSTTDDSSADRKSSGTTEAAKADRKSSGASGAAVAEKSSSSGKNSSGAERLEKSSAEENKAFLQPEKSAASEKSDTNTKSSSKKEKNSYVNKNSLALHENSSLKNGNSSSENAGKSPLPQKYDIVPSKNHAKIAFVIDDAGLNVNNLKHYTALPFPLTIAVLPRLSHSKDCAYVVRNSGQELILHQPMQSVNLNLNPGDGAITPEMSTFEIAQTIKQNLDEIGPNVKGINNHEGSLITANVIKIGTVLDIALERRIYFLDSRTNVETKAPQAALERDMEIYERDIFIDNVLDKDSMLKEILRGIDIANRKGHVIMIGHVDKSVNILPALLNELYPYLKEKGYVLCSVSGI